MSAVVCRTAIYPVPASSRTLFDVAAVVRGEVHQGFLRQIESLDGVHHSACDQTQDLHLGLIQTGDSELNDL